MSNIYYRKSDIFTSTTQVIVNTVNCEGYMGKGLALAFKQRYPAMFPIYQQECKTGKLRIGRPTLYQKSIPWILNFPTKNTWRANSRLEYLKKGLEYFVANYKKAGITSIAFPKLGAQNGKLSWDDVGPLMVKYLSQTDLDVYIYIADGDKEYYFDRANKEQKEAEIWKQFNEIALSQTLLQQAVSIKSGRDAKKIADRRITAEFVSMKDIETIEKLAATTKNSIKTFIHQQRFTTNQLPGMTSEIAPISQKNKKASLPKRRRTKKQPLEDKEQSLFSAYAEVS